MASSSRPSSVRGLYTPPVDEWVFLPPTVNPPPPSSTPLPSHLPTSLPDADIPSLSPPGVYGPLQLFATEYFTTALGMPFEVGKTLLQVEYRPRKRYAPEVEEMKQRDFGAEDDELSNPEEVEMYFTDRLSAPSIPLELPLDVPALPTDPFGYLPDLPSSWLLRDTPDISRSNGVLGMIRRIRYTPSEGLPALWKSQLITTLHSVLSTLLQPTIHLSLVSLFPSSAHVDIPLSAIPSPGLPLAIQVGTHFLTHWLLSPLEVIRTRLIVSPLSRSDTPSSAGMLRDMVEQEGGFCSLYFHPNLFIPTALEHTLRPLLTLSIPLVLERQWGISSEFSPLTYAACDLGLGLAGLFILLPIETTRKRLQIQYRGVRRKETGKRKSVVLLREREYVGVVEALWRIMTEETGARRKRHMTERDEGGVFSGIRQLYRGFGMAATAHLTVFGLGLVSAGLGGRGFDSGWKEI
ncbi:hypothetical protein M231_03933 [Tremella mesenterica]|uniref:Mitochondrial carrier n=1 Tax=Tremella mesenterica TaxID=5217 RepID=A0A4V1M412_TREME|nr:uncharacterized protein TREMEDRAFT_45447 [Tremella mesenterica DSM 1558]EIW66968.1 hypothetical protein TREMEDRAFT_45447 [Tremella mesenterica DSM 1558]RXK38757.1 hypothetical protein M231_03933 [Tremella mesenterica]